MTEYYRYPPSVLRCIKKNQQYTKKNKEIRLQEKKKEEEEAKKEVKKEAGKLLFAENTKRMEKNMQIERNRKEILSNLGRAIKNKRELLGLTEECLADILMIKEVDKYLLLERGERSMDIEQACRIVKLLQIPFDLLLDSVDVTHERKRLTEATKNMEQAIEKEVRQLQEQIEALKRRKTIVNRVVCNSSDE